jgi:surfeit locus 1 family protein
MKLIFAGARYKFSFLSFSLYAFFLILLVSLGFWQLGRADEKRLFLDKQKRAISKDSIELKSLPDSHANDYRYRKIKLSGVYDSEHQFLLDNQILNGKAGYFVLTPFKVDGSKQTVLINRGWIPLNKDRRILPILSINELNNYLIGRINKFPSVGLVLKNAEIPTDGWPSVVQVVNSTVLSNKIGYALFPFQIELDPDMNEGYLREWKQIKIMPVEKHIAYAVQWFGLAITLTLLFLWVSKTVDE